MEKRENLSLMTVGKRETLEEIIWIGFAVENSLPLFASKPDMLQEERNICKQV